TYGHRENELFPTASMIKVPIMIGVYDGIANGVLEYQQKLMFDDQIQYAYGSDLVGSLKIGSEITLSKLVFLMISTSDNTASLWAQNLAGTGEHINTIMEQNGYTKTKVNSRTPGREKAYESYGWGQTTTKEMVAIFTDIAEENILNSAACQDMQRTLSNQYWNSEGLSQIPPFVQTLAKSGAVSHSRSETILVYAPSGTYCFSIISKNQLDQSWASDNEGFAVLRTISKLLWEHFEPESPYLVPQDAYEFSK
ncbi:MAG: serine hydrolase, partial [Flavobacteriaceae bacterium]